MTHYALAWLAFQAGGTDQATALLASIHNRSADHFFPSRHHEQIVPEWVITWNERSSQAFFGLGNYYYDRHRYEDAILVWERGAALPDARIVFEFDQLKKRLNEPPDDRLAYLLDRMKQVRQRDDCTVELATLFNLTGQPWRSLEVLIKTRLHPWEGGEGKALRQYAHAHLQMGQKAMDRGKALVALKHFEAALNPPRNLGEDYHYLQAQADVNYWIGSLLRDLIAEPSRVRGRPPGGI